MKTKLLQGLLIGLVLFVASCQKDGVAPDIKVINKIEINGEKLPLNAAGFVDYSLKSFYGTAPTHKNVDLYTINGSFTTNKTGNLLDINGKTAVYVELNSPNLDYLEPGTYTYINSSEDNGLSNADLNVKYAGKYFISNGYVINSTESPSLLTYSENIGVSSGTVKVSGTKPNFLISYDLVLQNGQTLKGNYAGIFQNL
ncbi:hypothetical protein I5M32_10990 [Pedobacter sp. SD-b]|uniref:Uncharacterized protein n=1 Tax=Pedobacter segetis TaxID=2793069 RepID=A0ABS1BKS8_9SPHI|nr:hypothetical protein [Pedobacter segetis]MBK0383482.1 hypothetical protein [Pedobacter segetis]